MRYLRPAISLLCLFVFVLIGFAQDTPAGKKFAESFWKAVTDGKAYAAKSSLEAVKRREPNFDASKMEKALADMNSNREAEKVSAKNDFNSKNEAGKILGQLFERNLQADSFTKEAAVTNSIAENNKLSEKIFSLNRALIQSELDSTLRRVKSALSVNDRENTKLLTRINESLDGKTSEFMYYELLLRQSYWDNARKIFPDESDITAAYNSLSESIKSLGTPDQRNAKATKNLTAKIDAERLPKAAVRDAKLEKWFKDVFTDTSAMRNKNYTFLKAVILAPDYNIKRHPITGIVVGRARGAVIAFKDQDGKCKHGLYAISQEYVGGAFSGGTLSMDFDHQEMRCENINK